MRALTVEARTSGRLAGILDSLQVTSAACFRDRLGSLPWEGIMVACGACLGNSLRSVWFLSSLAFAFSATPANAQKGNADLDAVKAANQAFYAALSKRDTAAIQKVWSSDADIQNIGPRSKVADVGWEAQKKSYDMTFDAFPELKVSMPEPRIKINASTAWVSGIEYAERKTKNGEFVKGQNLGTSIFVKQGGRWRMVYHHASAMPR